MTWFENQRDFTQRPAVFADRSAARKRAMEWVQQAKIAAPVAVSGIFPRRVVPGADADRRSEPPAPVAVPLHAVHPVRTDSESRDSSEAAGADSDTSDAPVASAPPSLDPQLMERLEQSLADVAQVRERLLRASEHQLVALAARIARRVIARELSEDPKILLALATEGIEALVTRDLVTVRIGGWLQEDAFESLRARLQAQCPGCRIIQDPDLGVGACVVETDLGKVDESLDARLANVVSAILPDAQEGTR